MDLMNDVRRLASIGTVFIYIRSLFVIYSVIAGIAWWIDLAPACGVQPVRGVRDLGGCDRACRSSWRS